MTMHSLVRTLAVLLVAGTLLLPALGAADLPTSGDTYIGAGGPFGGATTINIAPGNLGLVQFDMTSIPASSTVAVAYLEVYVDKITAAGSITFSQVTSSWTEASATSAPSTNPPFASAPTTTANSFILVDVTSLVNSWLAVPATNFGIAIAGTDGTTLFLDTKENTLTSHPASIAVTIVGPQGPSGAPGGPGPIGATGATGPSGATGPKGLTGAAGATGVAGVRGATGPSGPAGAAGTAGVQGPSGAAGAAGPTGATGASGVQGPVGTTGVAGTNGLAGATGPTGITGNTGAAGAAGAAGPTGPQGVNGPNGNIGTMDTTVHPQSGYTIPDTDTFISYLTNNAGTTTTAGVPGILTLPHATVSGRKLLAIPVNATNVPTPCTATTCRIELFAQSGDTILGQANGGPGFMLAQGPVLLISDGNHHWYVIATQ